MLAKYFPIITNGWTFRADPQAVDAFLQRHSFCDPIADTMAGNTNFSLEFEIGGLEDAIGR